jgi:hypothetical protein
MAPKRANISTISSIRCSTSLRGEPVQPTRYTLITASVCRNSTCSDFETVPEP